MPCLISYVGLFEGIRIFEADWMPCGAGMALPGVGILVYRKAYNVDVALLRHEFGHILQARQTGTLQFYFRVGFPSLWSAMRHGKRGYQHHRHWTEVWANALAREYFSINQSYSA